jgi:hypothetical protein
MLYYSFFLAKDDTGMTDFLKDTLKNSRGEKENVKLKNLKLAYLTHRQISASEAVYRTFPSMHLKDSNVKTTFLPSGFPENRSVLYKKVLDTEEDFSDSDQEQEDICEKAVTIPGRKGVYKKSVTMHDKYMVRPAELEDICIAQFTTIFQSVKSVPKRCKMVGGVSEAKGTNKLASNIDHDLPKYIKLDGGLGYMAQRNCPSILRLHSSKKKEGHEQQYAELLLFTPWRNEESDLFRYDPEQCVTLYKDNFPVLKVNKETLFPYCSELEEIQKAMEDGTFDSRPAHIYDMLDSNCVQDNEDAFALGIEDDPDFAACNPDNLTNGQRSERFLGESFKFRQIQVEESDKLLAMTRKFVPEQMMCLEKVVKFCKSVVKSRVSSVDYPAQLLMTIHGGAGKY